MPETGFAGEKAAGTTRELATSRSHTLIGGHGSTRARKRISHQLNRRSNPRSETLQHRCQRRTHPKIGPFNNNRLRTSWPAGPRSKLMGADPPAHFRKGG